MGAIKEIKIPDIGGGKDVNVIEILVKPGDQIKKEDSIITLESDKASMEIPSPMAGKVKEIKLKVNDKVSEGDLILLLETEAKESVGRTQAEGSPGDQREPGLTKQSYEKECLEDELLVKVPDIGQVKDVSIIEILVKPGDYIKKDDSLITLESDKASMEVPSPAEGKIKELKVKVGDKVSEDTPLLTLITSEPTSKIEKSSVPSIPAEIASTNKLSTQTEIKVAKEAEEKRDTNVHAGPTARRMARELDVDLNLISGTGKKDRITPEDVQAFIKNAPQKVQAGLIGASSLEVDFAKFGPIEFKSLARIRRLSAAHVLRSWTTIPHVTQFDEADITELEGFRNAQKAEAEKLGFKLTPLVFLMKASVAALKKFPEFNASLDATGENLILKKYFNIGVAVDTPQGLVVAVIRDVDKKGLFDLADELAKLSQKARTKGLSLTEIQGGCFTISSLGGIGGTAFTPIVNAPDVAILGVSKSSIKPIYREGNFEPRLMLPISLSYDHRVIDGAEGARFTTYLCKLLGDIRQLLF